MRVPVVVPGWQRHRSDAARQVLDDLLPHLDLDLLGAPPDDLADHPVSVWFDDDPSPAALDLPDHTVVWCPMFGRTLHQPTWTRPRRAALKVVAFSEPVRRKAERRGLACLDVRYHPDPAALSPVDRDGPRTVFYWNRVGMAGPALLSRLVQATRAERLLYRDAPDGRQHARNRRRLTADDVGAEVVEIRPRSRDEHLELTAPATVVLAPRVWEGIGLVALEAMARGAAVVGVRAPTLDEYVRHGESGWLLEPATGVGGIARRVAGRVLRHPLTPPVFRPPPVVPARQDWDGLAHLDVDQLGAAARRDQTDGRARWRQQTAELAAFIAG